MKYPINEFKKNTDNLFSKSIEYFDNSNFYSCFRAVCVAKELYHFLEEPEMIGLCNSCLDRGIEKKVLTKEQREMFEEMGKQKANFLIGISFGGRQFISEELQRQNRNH